MLSLVPDASLKWRCYSLSHVWLFATPWTVAHQAPVSMGFSRQEYWSGLPFPTPGDPPQGWNLDLLHCRQILYHLSHQVSESMSSHPVLREFTLSSAVLFVQKLSMFHAMPLWFGERHSTWFWCALKKGKGKENYVSRFYAHSIKHLLLSLIQNEEM